VLRVEPRRVSWRPVSLALLTLPWLLALPAQDEGSLVTLDGEHPWTPPATAEAWERRAAELRIQLLVAAGLYPLEEREPVHPTIHGRIERQGYTVEKVFFESLPGFTVTGNLYRPVGAGPFAGVLSPHGHWAGGRFSERSLDEARHEVLVGAEEHVANARYHLQARCAQLARMGCVVFHYDMVGFGDSPALTEDRGTHAQGFGDVEAELHSMNTFGLQTWNSIRALDFLAALPDVDPERLGVTGASGGGTQTFVLCAIDERPRVAFPACMVSLDMQGGCICENASHLRVDTNNVELAALMAPRALGLSGADDWTCAIESRGLPELRSLYATLGRPGAVTARCWPHFPHNFNLPARVLMYEWFAEHLELDVQRPVGEAELDPIPPAELSVFDAEHPRPPGTFDVARLRAHWLAREATAEATRAALPALLHPRKHSNEEDAHLALPLRVDAQGTVVLVVSPAGSGALHDRDAPLNAIAVRASRPPVDTRHAQFVGYTFGYNRTLLAERVGDILAAVRAARRQPGVARVRLAGLGEAGPWVILAAALAGDEVDRTLAAESWTFTAMDSLDDPNFLPGALRFGGLPAFARLIPPGRLRVGDEIGWLLE